MPDPPRRRRDSPAGAAMTRGLLQAAPGTADRGGMALRRHALALVGAVVAVVAALVVSQPQLVTSFVHV